MITSRRQFFTALRLPIPSSPASGEAPEPSLEVHAANRVMFGPRPGDVAAIAAQGYDAFIDEQLNPASIPDTECDTFRATLGSETLTESWAQLFDRRSNPDYTEAIKPINQVRHHAWARMLLSRRQLQERMVNFWHDHFNAYGFDFIIRSMWPKWDDVMRTHALGNFRAMLEATATNPCMLYYLDNYISTNAGPNENYARELFELHTLGAINYQTPGGYIDQDVYEASRCFTGWTFNTTNAEELRGQFVYKNDGHDRFIKFVLNTMIPGDQAAMKDGRDVLDLLANHMGTARHIALKLAKKFVSDYPPDSIVESTAQVFYDNRTAPDQIKKTMEHLLKSAEFKAARMTKFKRPIDWAASLMRAMPIPYTTDDTFVYLYERLGQPMFQWRTPDGAPDVLEHWSTSSGLLQRWNFIFETCSGWYVNDGLPVPTTAAAPGDLQTARQISDWWIARIIGREPSSETRQSILEFAADGRNPDLALPDEERLEKLNYTGALCAMTPDFMRH